MSVGVKPSVLMVSYQYAPVADGGAERQAQVLAEKLAARGWPIGVVTARYPGTARFECVAGVDVHRVWAIPRPRRFSATFLPSLARFLLLQGRRYAIWHAHQAFYNAGISLSLARLLGRRCVVKDACSGIYGDLARLSRVKFGGWVKRQLRRADAVISLNSEMTDELLGAGVANSRIRPIPNGVDCDRFSPATRELRLRARGALGIPPTSLVALFAGRLAEDKGISYLIDAWRHVETKGPAHQWCLIIAGEELRQGEYRPRGERELRTVRFVGKVPDIRPLLQAADVLIHPSLSEGLSNVVLEAMATGLPVVGTRTAGLKEQVVDGVTGVLVSPRDAEALAEAVGALLGNGERRVRLGAAGRDRAVQRFDLSSVVDAYEKLYHELMPLPVDSAAVSYPC